MVFDAPELFHDWRLRAVARHDRGRLRRKIGDRCDEPDRRIVGLESWRAWLQYRTSDTYGGPAEESSFEANQHLAIAEVLRVVVHRKGREVLLHVESENWYVEIIIAQ